MLLGGRRLLLRDEEIFDALNAEAEAQHGQTIFEVLNPPVGPCRLFHHLGGVRERARGVILILRRLFDASEELTLLPAEIAERPINQPPNVPIARRTSEITHEMKVDYESLFHFGSVLLDQWAYASGCLAGAVVEARHPFNQLVDGFDRDVATALRPIKEQFLSHVRWLHFWMRTFRNGFVVHEDRPLQRSLTRGPGNRFALFRPSPPGWEDDAALEAEALALLPHAPERVRQADSGYWERARPRALLEAVIENVGQIDRQSDRNDLASLAKRMGVSTPTFQVVASVLADFVGRATPLLVSTALTVPHEINLGRPPRRP